MQPQNHDTQTPDSQHDTPESASPEPRVIQPSQTRQDSGAAAAADSGNSDTAGSGQIASSANDDLQPPDVASPPLKQETTPAQQRHTRGEGARYRFRDGVNDTFTAIKHNAGRFIGFYAALHIGLLVAFSLLGIFIAVAAIGLGITLVASGAEPGVLLSPSILLFALPGAIMMWLLFAFVHALYVRILGNEIVTGMNVAEGSQHDTRPSLWKVFVSIAIITILLFSPLLLMPLISSILAMMASPVLALPLGLILVIVAVVLYIVIWVRFAPLPFVFVFTNSLSLKQARQNTLKASKQDKSVRNYSAMLLLVLFGASLLSPLLAAMSETPLVVLSLPLSLLLWVAVPVLIIGPLTLLVRRHRHLFIDS